MRLRGAHDYLLNRRTGKIEFRSEDFDLDADKLDADEEDDRDEEGRRDEPDLIGIDPLPSRVWYLDMVDFAAHLHDDQARRRLMRAVEGRGAFRRFKDTLHEDFPDLVRPWYDFSNNRGLRRAVEWLVDEELIASDAGERWLDEHPDPDAPNAVGDQARDTWGNHRIAGRLFAWLARHGYEDQVGLDMAVRFAGRADLVLVARPVPNDTEWLDPDQIALAVEIVPEQGEWVTAAKDLAAAGVARLWRIEPGGNVRRFRLADGIYVKDGSVPLESLLAEEPGL